MMTSVKISTILRLAAERIENPENDDYTGDHDFCCNALKTVEAQLTNSCYGKSTRALAFFEDLYRDDFHAGGGDFHKAVWFGNNDETNRGLRVIALYLAAEFAESEGL